VLSNRQRRILEFVYQYTQQKGYAPTIREIGEGTETSSTSVVNYNLQQLVNQHYLLKTPCLARAYRLTQTALALVGEGSDFNDNSRDVEALQEEITRLQNENERLRREHKAKMRSLYQEYAHLVNEIYFLRQRT